jgi:hypothetical protein
MDISGPVLDTKNVAGNHMAKTIDLDIPHDPAERERRRTTGARARIAEVLSKYNTRLSGAPLDALVMAVERMIEAERERCARAVETHPWPTKCAEAMWPLEREMVAQTIRQLRRG